MQEISIKMTTYIHKQVEAARLGTAPSLVSRVPSGWVVLCDMQFLPGYCILLPDPVVSSLNDLNRPQRADYLCDMALVGDAVMEVTGAFRINYAIFGNSEPALHAHIVPRYLSEPDELRHGPPWAYAPEVIDAHKFDLERDRSLVERIAFAIKKRL
jgi:diadenosine tetraphosphate (Ap4A) HIT family hydrolase